MPMVMTVGCRTPVSYRDWAAWRASHRPATRVAEPLPRICGMCWGAGRILTPAGNGEGLIPCGCAACAGRGHAPAPTPAVA